LHREMLRDFAHLAPAEEARSALAQSQSP